MNDARDTIQQHTESPTARGHGVRRGLFLGLGVGAALVLSAVPAVVLVAATGASGPGGALVIGSATLQFVALVATATWSARRALRGAVPPGVAEALGSRAENAEAALAREQERLHEIRATLAGITASHRMLHDHRASLLPEHRSRLERLHETELARLERLLNDRASTPTSAVDLDAVIETLVESLRARGHDVRWERAGLVAEGRCDDVVEVIHVLLENAARHARGHGMEVATVRRGDGIEVRVSDRGPGIDPRVLPDLFQRGARRPSSPGQGLGLHIAQRLTGEMGGRLAVETPAVPSAGAVFVLVLPAFSSAELHPALSG